MSKGKRRHTKRVPVRTITGGKPNHAERTYDRAMIDYPVMITLV